MEIRKTMETRLEMSEAGGHPRMVLQECRRMYQAREGDALDELRELIFAAVQLERYKPAESECIRSGGVYYVRVSPRTEVSFRYRILRDSQVGMTARELRINGRSATLGEVMALYMRLRAKQGT